MVSAAFITQMERLQDSSPQIKVEITIDDVTTDLTTYYLSGANFQQIKERAPDEIQAGDFVVSFANHDNTFSEFVPSSLFFGKKYHGSKIVISMGLVLPDGTVEYSPQATGFIDDLFIDPSLSMVTLRCRDRIRKAIDRNLHQRPSGETLIADSENTGNGTASDVVTKPFKTITENWTLECTTPGEDGVAEFSVVGSVSGNVGTAISSAVFSTGDGAGGVKFTIQAGSIPWSAGDTFTFNTKKYPEWVDINVVKIIWSVLTGYDWDSDTKEDFSDFCLDFDHSQSEDNVDINYESFVNSIDALDTITGFNITGYAKYNENTVEFLQGLTLLFLGSIYTEGDGRLAVNVYNPNAPHVSSRSFTDDKKISFLGYSRTVDEVINYVSVHYKKVNAWEFSDETVIYQGNYVALNQQSINDHDKNYYTQGFTVAWYQSNGQHVQDFANRLVLKYAYEPLNIDLTTGLDALETNIGDIVSVTDTKYALNNLIGEVCKIQKQFDENPKSIALRIRRDSDLELLFGFLGSRADEGDGLSPQANTYGAASDADKGFCYLGSRADSEPGYKMF
jgi:hypothetical protein